MHYGCRKAKIPQRIYKRELAKARLGDNIANHMGYIYINILYDKFDFTFKQVTDFYNKVIERRKLWQSDSGELTSNDLIEYCWERNIDVCGWVKSIPMSQKLFLADLKKNKAVLGADFNIESALASTMYLVIPVLHDNYRFSHAKIDEFMEWSKRFIYEYFIGNLNDEIIKQIFIEDENWDIEKGEKAEARLKELYNN